MESAIYTGRVRHRRFSPKKHEFNYKVFMTLLDLDEIPDVFSQSRFWSSTTSLALVRFKRDDFFGETDKPLKQAVLDWVYEQTGEALNGPVRMLANLRFFGILINPIVCYYCYSDDGENLEYVVTEVTNTPWGQRQHYLLPCNSLGLEHGESACGEFMKTLHVSPFHPMDMCYEWKLDRPTSRLNLHFDNFLQSGKESKSKGESEKVFDASLILEREPLTASNMRAILWRFPLMTLKVVAAIYWQAFKLWVKGMPLYSNPDQGGKPGGDQGRKQQSGTV